MKNDFFLSEFKVRVKFESMSNEVDAHIYFTPNIEVKNLNKTFVSDIGCNVLYCPVLKRDELYDLEVQCIIENKRTDIEYVKFLFIDDKKKEQIVKIRKTDFKDAMKLFE